ncbi:MAG: alpha/beta hydrolase [Bacteroidia bacterium]|nr:alpha/beta hydrolase [Bacteroidia bacterium]
MLKKLITPKSVGSFLNFLALIWPSKTGAISFRLFCTPQKGRSYTSKDERFLSKAKQEKIALSDFEIQTYEWEGSGKKILLAHGWDSNAARWRGLIPVLQRENYSILALDAPAHGRSGSKLANGVIYAEAIGKVIEKHKPDYVLGHSFGGMAAAFYFADPTVPSVEKLILMGTPSRLSTIMENFNEVLGLNERSQKATARIFEEKIGFPIEFFAVERYIKEAKISGLVMHDVGDPVAPFSQAIAIQENWANSTFYQTEGLGHSMQAGSVFKRIIAELKGRG